MTEPSRTYPILVVEDDPISRKLLARRLETAGYRVGVLADGESAREELKNNPPALLLLDIQLPGLTGLELLGWLRGEPALRRLPVILISGLDRPKDVVRGLELGASDYVTKPISFPVLLARIRTQLLISEMVVRLETQAKILARLAAYDELTGVFNRLGLSYFLKSEVERSLRYREPLAALMIDIDHFKPVNDLYGHPAGDRVLRRVAELISSTLRGPDLLCRYGGEEFLVILPHTSPDQAREAGERIRKEIAAVPFRSEENEIPLTVSVGAAGLDPEAEEPGEEMIAAADAALYRAKREGRNRVRSADLR
ncbi:MAG: diguanylate cyclase [Candidatus Erginobacter occultus]|nr:diguanylate cyclase [Candidatus Erginobacter occultus]